MSTKLDVRLAEQQLGDDLDHWACCRDHDKALCGIDLTGSPTEDFEVASCSVCEWMAERDGWVCPLGNGFCPQ